MKWFKVYIGGRCQYVEITGKKSEVLEINQGCFQGSIGAPLLFCDDVINIEIPTVHFRHKKFSAIYILNLQNRFFISNIMSKE